MYMYMYIVYNNVYVGGVQRMICCFLQSKTVCTYAAWWCELFLVVSHPYLGSGLKPIRSIGGKLNGINCGMGWLVLPFLLQNPKLPSFTRFGMRF